MRVITIKRDKKIVGGYFPQYISIVKVHEWSQIKSIEKILIPWINKSR